MKFIRRNGEKRFVQNEEIKNVTCVDGVCFCNSE